MGPSRRERTRRVAIFEWIVIAGILGVLYWVLVSGRSFGHGRIELIVTLDHPVAGDVAPRILLERLSGVAPNTTKRVTTLARNSENPPWTFEIRWATHTYSDWLGRSVEQLEGMPVRLIVVFDFSEGRPSQEVSMPIPLPMLPETSHEIRFSVTVPEEARQ